MELKCSKDNQNVASIAGDYGSKGSVMEYGRYQSTDPIFTIKLGDKEKEEKNVTEEHAVTHPTSYADTMLHIFKGNIGSGLLAMGDAYKNGGIIFAPIMTVILGVISVHAQHMLLNCSDEVHQRLGTNNGKPPDFATTVELCFELGPKRLRKFSKAMKFLVNLFLCVTQLGFCCVYIVFISTNLKKILDMYDINIDLSVHMVIVLFPILLSCLVRNLKYLTPFSTVANVLMVVGVALVLYEATQDLPPVSSRTYFANWQQLPLFFGTTIYAFEGIGLVLPLKSEMAKPHKFQKPLGVLNVGMVVVGVIFVFVGFLGFLKWGDDVQGSLTLNMPSGEIKSQIVQTAIALGILFSYPLQFYVPVDIMWPAILKKYSGLKWPVAAELCFRSFLVFITFVLAESIPHLSLFISLVGAVSSTTLALIFPPLIEMAIRSQDAGGCSAFSIFKNVIICFMGVFIFVTGTYESVSSIVKVFHNAE